MLSAAVVFGCGHSAPEPPKFDPDAIAHAAMEEFDKNKDGKLDEDELENCPALKSALQLIAGQGRNYITEEDLAKRLEKFQKSGVAYSAVRCRVTRGGQGVKDITVSLIPEKFLGGTIKPASGVSDEDGDVVLKAEGSSIPGVNLGYYRVEASMKDDQGNELLAPRYNKESKFGLEVPNKQQAAVDITIES